MRTANSVKDCYDLLRNSFNIQPTSQFETAALTQLWGQMTRERKNNFFQGQGGEKTNKKIYIQQVTGYTFVLFPEKN